MVGLVELELLRSGAYRLPFTAAPSGPVTFTALLRDSPCLTSKTTRSPSSNDGTRFRGLFLEIPVEWTKMSSPVSSLLMKPHRIRTLNQRTVPPTFRFTMEEDGERDTGESGEPRPVGTGLAFFLACAFDFGPLLVRLGLLLGTNLVGRPRLCPTSLGEISFPTPGNWRDFLALSLLSYWELSGSRSCAGFDD